MRLTPGTVILSGLAILCFGGFLVSTLLGVFMTGAAMIICGGAWFLHEEDNRNRRY